MVKKTLQEKKNMKGSFSALAGGVISLALSATALAILFFGDEFSGGIPFINKTVNQTIGKVSIFIGAVFTGWLAVIAFREFFKG